MRLIPPLRRFKRDASASRRRSRAAPARPSHHRPPGSSIKLGSAATSGVIADFLIDGDTCTGTELQPGQSCTTGIRFIPSAVGTRNALLTVPSADGKAAVSPWYLRFEVLDVPGVLASIAGNLAEAGVSIESMIQRGRSPGEPVAIVMITHETSQVSVARALKAIAASDKVFEAPCMIPMEAA